MQLLVDWGVALSAASTYLSFGLHLGLSEAKEDQKALKADCMLILLCPSCFQTTSLVIKPNMSAQLAANHDVFFIFQHDSINLKCTGAQSPPTQQPPPSQAGVKSTLSLCDWDICSTADTPPCRPALFQSWASPSSDCPQKPFLSPCSSISPTRVNTHAAPGAITDMLRPSVKPLSATYQHTGSPL